MPPRTSPEPTSVDLDNPAFDTSRPNIARIYDALLGGKDNYEADREAAQALTEAIPSAVRAAHDNRAFLRRVVTYLARAGIAQFLDIGTGLPAQGSVHEVAQEISPGARVLCVDNDPVVLAHAEALLSKAEGVMAVERDVQYPRELLGRRMVREFLDFDQPIAVLLVAVLHFVGDEGRPWEAVKAITDRLAPGSYLVVSHVTGDELPEEAIDRAREIYAETFVPGTVRRRSEILRFFTGTSLIDPGLVDVAHWKPDRPVRDRPTVFWAGVGRK
jgi:hypothetical protein